MLLPLKRLTAKAHSARFSLCFADVLVFRKKKEIWFVLLFVYLCFLRTSAAAITAMTIITAAPAMSGVSVGIPLSGCGATVGDAVAVCVGVSVGATDSVGVGVVVVVGCWASAGPTMMRCSTKYRTSPS